METEQQPGNPEQAKRTLLPYLGLGLVLLLVFWWSHDYMIRGFTGFINDDATYLASAQSMAQGKGYTLPWATKPHVADRFPIGFPAFLSLFFLIPATLEQHVRWMQEVEVVLTMGFLAAAFLYCYRYLKLPAWACLGGVILTAVSPFTPYLSGIILSDLPFGLVFTLAIWQAHKAFLAPETRRLFVAGAVSAAAVLVRYAGGILPVCLVGWFLVRKQYRAAAIYAATTGLLLLPWVAWVARAKAFGYAQQFAHQGYAPGDMRILTLAFSAAQTFMQALPSFFLPAIYLPGFPDRSVPPYSDPTLAVVGLVLSAAFVAGVAFAWRSPPLRFPVTVVFAYLTLVLLWQTGFLNLGEHLTVRLLLPIMPLAMALSLFGLRSLIPEGRRVYLALGLGICAAMLVTVGMHGLALHERMVKAAVPALVAERTSLYALVREFARQVPATETAATNAEPLFYLLTGRKCRSVAPNPNHMIGLIANTDVKYFVAVPVWVGGKDLMVEAVKAVNRQLPGSIYVIYTPGGIPMGIFRVDRQAFEQAIAKRRKPA